MTAVRELVFAAVEAALRTIAGVKEIQRMSAGDPSRYPALFIEDGGQGSDPNSEPDATRYDLTVQIEGFVAGGDGNTAHAEMNALYVSVVETLMADATLLDLVEQLDEGALRPATAVLASKRRIGFLLDFNIVFVGGRTSPSLKE